jgi:hypothetical protein
MFCRVLSLLERAGPNAERPFIGTKIPTLCGGGCTSCKRGGILTRGDISGRDVIDRCGLFMLTVVYVTQCNQFK